MRAATPGLAHGAKVERAPLLPPLIGLAGLGAQVARVAVDLPAGPGPPVGEQPTKVKDALRRVALLHVETEVSATPSAPLSPPKVRLEAVAAPSRPVRRVPTRPGAALVGGVRQGVAS